jgi:hypothetical protein
MADLGRTKEATISGWGADEALSADISVVSGVGVKRTGKTKILGSPTLADYHPEDPHPGMLNPTVRADLLKTDGAFPRPNPCAGDSGGPLLVKQRGTEYVAGIGSWTGLWCEEYALFTRVAPFASWFEQGIVKAGSLPVTLHLECVGENRDGSLSAYFGYENPNAVSLVVPHGTHNALTNDAGALRPTRFQPGFHDWVVGVTFQASETVVYTVEFPNGSSSTVRVDASSPRCGPDLSLHVQAADSCAAALQAECIAEVPATPEYRYSDFEECTDITLEFSSWTAGCEAEWNALQSCYAATPPESWACFEWSLTPTSTVCDAEQISFEECMFGGG